MKRRGFAGLGLLGITAAAGLALLGGLSGCTSLMGPRVVSFSESQIVLLLDKQFPMERTVMQVIDLSVTNPRVSLMPESNRLGTELDVAAVDRLFGSHADGHVKLDYGLRFEPSDHTIRMTQVRIRDLALQSGANMLHGAPQRIGTLVAENMLDNLVLYRMRASQADEMDRLDLQASPIEVTPQGIQMTISARPH